MMKGGDVCCDYTDGRNCGTFPVSGPQDTAEECADTGAVDTTSLSLRMPLNRKCVPPPRPLARFADSTSTAILVQLPVLGDRAAVPVRRLAEGRRHRRGLCALPRPHRGELLFRLTHPCALSASFGSQAFSWCRARSRDRSACGSSSRPPTTRRRSARWSPASQAASTATTACSGRRTAGPPRKTCKCPPISAAYRALQHPLGYQPVTASNGIP